MKSTFVAAIFLLFLVFDFTESKVNKLGLTGRYCAQGEYNINTGELSHFNGDHWCGLHEIDFRACVSISYKNNQTDMGCDNDGGIFPTCNHNSDYCYMQGDLYICCCNSDHCNDCSKFPHRCVSPLAYINTTPVPTTTTPTPSITSCPSGSISWQKHCYFFQKTPSAFLVAENACMALGGHLVSIHDEFANSFIAQYAGVYFHDNFWIGGSDMMTPQTWTWTDNSDFTFAQWHRGSPANGNGDCVTVSLDDGTWRNADCFKHQPYVCAL